MTQKLSDQGEFEKEKKLTSIGMRKFNCYSMIFAPIIYIVILIILQIYDNRGNTGSTTVVMDVFLIFCFFYGVVSIFLIYEIFIPLARRGKTAEDRFAKFFIVLIQKLLIKN